MPVSSDHPRLGFAVGLACCLLVLASAPAAASQTTAPVASDGVTTPGVPSADADVQAGPENASDRPVAEFEFEAHRFCRLIEDRDGDDQGDCIGEGDVFAVEDGSVYSQLEFADVTESVPVRWVWSTPSDERVLRGTVEPGDSRFVSSSVSFEGYTGRVELTVYINGRRWFTDQFRREERPTAALEFDPSVPTEGESVTFDASPSTDDAGIDSYVWQFEDGSNATGRRATYSVPNGTDAFDVTLTVTDESGLSATVTERVRVNAEPVAVIDRSPSAVREGERVQLSAERSSDAEGPIEQFQWDFGANGTVDATGVVVETPPIDDADYAVALTVTDGDGESTRTVENVTVLVDTDGDGLVDSREESLGTDPTKADTDGDGLDDAREIELGTDPTREDSDADGATDRREVDAASSPTDPDTDDDGVLDGRELAEGTDPMVADTDGDGLDDGAEFDAGSDPLVADTDGDGALDGEEVDAGADPTVADTDGDGLDDGEELDAGTNPTASDTDGDGLGDQAEVEELATDATVADTDGDGLDDGEEVDGPTNATIADTDGDGLLDGEEATGESDPTVADTDGDGLDDGREANLGTDPTMTDTDGDGLGDAAEVRYYDTDPTASDTDGDGLDDGREVEELATDPTDADTDGDGLDDALEVTDLPSNATDADTDGDGLNDSQERARGSSMVDADTDDDLFTDDVDPLYGSVLLPLAVVQLIVALGLYAAVVRV